MRLIILPPGLASRRRSRLTSNVMPHRMPFAPAATRFGRQGQHTEDKTRFLVAAIASCARRTWPPVVHPGSRTERHAALSEDLMDKIGRVRHVKLKMAKDTDAELQFEPRSGCEHQFKLNVGAVAVRRALHSEPLVRGARRSGGTAPALPSAETGWRLRWAIRNCQLGSQRTGAA